MAKEARDPEQLTRWPYEPSMSEKREELLARYKHMHFRAEMEAAELRAEMVNVRRGLGDLNALLQTAESQREALEEIVRRARAIIRNKHLKEKPSHRSRMDCRGKSIGPIAGQEKLKDWCVTCAVLIQMEIEGGGK